MTLKSKNLAWMVLGIAVIVGSGVVQGIQNDRWGKSQELLEASQRLDSLPASFGDWTSTDSEISEKELAVAEATGSLSRRYTNSKTGEAVSVMILCGKPGPISVHPPTVCFIGAGWRLESEPTVTTIENPNTVDQPATLWNGRFSKRMEGQAVTMDTVWAWNNDGHWIARENPRLETAGNKYLYKMYVSTIADRSRESRSLATTQAFLDEFLPIVESTLFPDNS